MQICALVRYYQSLAAISCFLVSIVARFLWSKRFLCLSLKRKRGKKTPLILKNITQHKYVPASCSSHILQDVLTFVFVVEKCVCYSVFFYLKKRCFINKPASFSFFKSAIWSLNSNDKTRSFDSRSSLSFFVALLLLSGDRGVVFGEACCWKKKRSDFQKISHDRHSWREIFKQRHLYLYIPVASVCWAWLLAFEKKVLLFFVFVFSFCRALWKQGTLTKCKTLASFNLLALIFSRAASQTRWPTSMLS